MPRAGGRRHRAGDGVLRLGETIGHKGLLEGLAIRIYQSSKAWNRWAAVAASGASQMTTSGLAGSGDRGGGAILGRLAFASRLHHRCRHSQQGNNGEMFFVVLFKENRDRRPSRGKTNEIAVIHLKDLAGGGVDPQWLVLRNQVFMK